MNVCKRMPLKKRTGKRQTDVRGLFLLQQIIYHNKSLRRPGNDTTEPARKDIQKQDCTVCYI